MFSSRLPNFLRGLVHIPRSCGVLVGQRYRGGWKNKAESHAEMIYAVPDNAGRLSIRNHKSMEGSHLEGKCPSSAAVRVFSTCQRPPSASCLYGFVRLNSTPTTSLPATTIDESGLVGVGGGAPGQEVIDGGTWRLSTSWATAAVPMRHGGGGGS